MCVISFSFVMLVLTLDVTLQYCRMCALSAETVDRFAILGQHFSLGTVRSAVGHVVRNIGKYSAKRMYLSDTGDKRFHGLFNDVFDSADERILGEILEKSQCVT